MQAIQPLRIVFQRNSPIVKTAVRFAGGGGRPGGLPTFDWKERKQLGLGLANEKEVDFTARPIGFDFADLEKFIDPSRGDQVIDLSNVSEWKESREMTTNHRKQIDVTMLFGSNKPCGTYVSPKEKASAAAKAERREKRRAAKSHL